ncbi:hypothetical protein [Sporichthya sp.]|uniref:hypothetical protein n=1 Tax=Sporichthya sp. TaxID=65475 RepID=UPI001843A43C|nr:hypothetical protein [Sporichthya sp.]MBA3745182.1 hypothetical protein [Sporichthya sp.]
MGGDLVEAFADLESVASACRKLLAENSWRLADSDIVDVTRCLHRVESTVRRCRSRR